MEIKKKKKHNFTNTQIIAFSFFAVISTGGLLLSLPISSRSSHWTPFVDALFTATSATCVTGLVTYDTFDHWSPFGQIVILSLIQIGGLGFMTLMTLLYIFMKRKISLHERRILMQSAGNVRISGIVKMIQHIALGTLLFEFTGAVLLSIRFIPQMGVKMGIYNAVFHSVSAFCNAGFDLMGRYEKYSSLTSYSNDPLVILTIGGLIATGGIGFLVWTDVTKHRFHFKNYTLHSKIVLCTTLILIVAGAVLFYIFEYNYTMKDYSFGHRFLASLFQSITPRTAGFNSININELSESSKLLTMMLMLIGGSPGSTAGGIKTTTFVVVILSIVATSRNMKSIQIFKRRLGDDIVRESSAIVTIYILFSILATLIICAINPVSLSDAVFEVISAVGTVGLSSGVTGVINPFSKCVLILGMFGGRVGLLSFTMLLTEKENHSLLNRPKEKILIG